MASNSLQECAVCNEDFDEGARCPRTLPCSHYFCTNCINKLIGKNVRQCPCCCQNFQANSAENVMINRAVLDFLKYSQTTQYRILYEKGATPVSERIEYLIKETVDVSNCVYSACDDAKADAEEVVQEIERISKELHNGNAKIQKEILPKIHQIEVHNFMKKRGLENWIKDINSQLKAISKKQTKLIDVQERLNVANTNKEAAAIMDEAEKTNAAIGEWAEKCKEKMSKEKMLLQTTDKGVHEITESINKIMQVLSSFNEQTILVPRMTPVTSQEELPRQLSIEDLRRMSEPVKCLVEQGRVFAVQQHQRTKYARITIRDNKLLLHHLIEGPLPANAHLLKHMDVLSLVDPSSRLAFLELGTSKSIFGKLFISLTPDTQGANQFALLCTGQMGPSYAKTTLLNVCNKGQEGESVRFGDYEHNNGSGGKALVAGLHVVKEYTRPTLSGTVMGVGWKKENSAISAQFIIRTRTTPGKNCCPAFGIVEYGLNTLTEAITRYPKIKEVFITDCGLVLSS